MTHFLFAISAASLAGLAFGVYHYFQTENTEQLTGSAILPFHALRPVNMGLFCIVAIIIAFQKLRSGSTKTAGLIYACILLMTLMVFLLSIRLVIVCWLVIVLFLLIKTVQKLVLKTVLITASILILVISGFSIPAVKKQWSELFDRSANTTIILHQDSSLGRSWGGKALRIAIWTCSTDILKDHLLFGVGTGDVQDSLQQAYDDRKFYFASRYNRYNAHNEYLQVTLANGIPGLLILLSCIAYPLVNYRKHFSGDTYFLFLLVFTLAGISESILEVNKGIIWYSFFNSIFAFGYLKPDQQ
jgi:O-antigen ligase